ncbi:hypothetical protein [Pseudogulbenkiania sp. MAI-1]|uniref:hypothetical protein n=1 Tax=Pseudogulbenkiania sp. MAI-1 TaxID=990370 RepID=UPI00045EB02C|nr:hypothetical protein [Pseudogulbenkiania sp. MAI-1]
MTTPQKISRFLPLTFPNGNRISRFAKACPHCHGMVTAREMEGLARLLHDKIVLAAEAECPDCHRRFPVTCVISDDKRVHRVRMPLWLFRIWLKLALRNLPEPQLQEDWSVPEEAPRAGIRLANNAEITRSSEVLGQFDGTPISAWLEVDGRRFVFERALPPAGQLCLSDSELLFEGKLVYKPA